MVAKLGKWLPRVAGAKGSCTWLAPACLSSPFPPHPGAAPPRQRASKPLRAAGEAHLDMKKMWPRFRATMPGVNARTKAITDSTCAGTGGPRQPGVGAGPGWRHRLRFLAGRALRSYDTLPSGPCGAGSRGQGGGSAQPHVCVDHRRRIPHVQLVHRGHTQGQPRVGQQDVHLLGGWVGWGGVGQGGIRRRFIVGARRPAWRSRCKLV